MEVMEEYVLESLIWERGENRLLQLNIARSYCRGYDDPEGFDVRFINDDIGDGVFTTRRFQCDDFLLEYKGDLIKNIGEAQSRERKYAIDDLGSFLYFFKYKSKTMCIDATHDVSWQGRMVNDAEKGSKLQNCVMKIVEVGETPHLCIFASRDIELGEELRFDYGVPNLYWRKEKKSLTGTNGGGGCSGDDDSKHLMSGTKEKQNESCSKARSESGSIQNVNVEYEDGNKIDGDDGVDDGRAGGGDSESKEVNPGAEEKQNESCSKARSESGSIQNVNVEYEDGNKIDGDDGVDDGRAGGGDSESKEVNPGAEEKQNESCSKARSESGSIQNVNVEYEDGNKIDGDDGVDDGRAGGGDSESKEVNPGAGIQCWGSLIAKKRKKYLGVFPMTSTVLAIGSAPSNDIIVKGSADYEILLEVNRQGQVFLRNRLAHEVKFLKDKESFIVGKRVFEWHYPVRRGQEELSDQEDTDSFEGTDDENDPDYKQPDSDTYESEIYSPDPVDDCSENETSAPQTTYQSQNRNAVNDHTYLDGATSTQCNLDTYESEIYSTDPVDDCSDNETSAPQTTYQSQNKNTVNDHTDIDGATSTQCNLGQEELSDQENTDAFEGTDDENDPDYKQPDSDTYESEIYSDDPVDDCSENETSAPQTTTYQSQNRNAVNDHTDIDGATSTQCNLDTYESEIYSADPVDDCSENETSAPQTTYQSQNKKAVNDHTDIDGATSTQCNLGNRSSQHCHKRSISLKRQMSNITVPIYSKKEDGKRDYSKVNHCLFCKRSFTSKISDHYLNIHVNEEKVRAARLLPIGSPERKKALLELENRGNFQHNVKTIEKGNGELVVARRPSAKNSKNYGAEKFLPCEYCLGFYFQESLWLHMSSCKFRPQTEQPSTNCVRDAQVMLTPFIKDITDEDARLEGLFDGMKETNANPGLPHICKNDMLIREFAKSLQYRLGEQNEQRIKDVDNIRTKVRTVGRLLKELNSDGEYNLPLTEYITPKNFFKVVNATKELSLKSDSPQAALVLGHYIKQISLLKVSMGIINDCQEQQNEGRDFQLLYQAHWNHRVSCIAKRRQKLRQLNKSSGIPLTEDLVTLKNFVKNELRECIKVPNPDDKMWKRTAQLTIVRINLFNKSRIAEVQELKVSDYLDAGRNDETDENIFNSFEISDRILSKRMKVVEVRGKSVRGLRKVFMILAPDMMDALEYLMTTRCSNSPFMFCRKSDKTPLDGCEAMREVTKMCPGLKHPERIRSRKIRKYLATTSQLIDMTDAELKMVADHMGHNLNVHTDVYRLQSSLLEKTKVARVLIAMENGCVGNFKGRNIQDIQIDKLPAPISHNDEWTMEAENSEPMDAEDENTEATTQRVERFGTTEPMEATLPAVGDENTAKNNGNIEMSGSGSDSDVSGDGLKRRKAPQNQKIKRVRWSEEENDLFRDKMRPFLTEKTMPPSHVIHGLTHLLKNRTVAQIRTKIHNIISGKLKRF